MSAAYNVPASAALAERGIVGEEVLRRIDGFLAGRRQDEELDPRVISLDTAVPESDVMLALEEYTKEGVLSREDVVRCSIDGTSAEASLVEEARANGDTFPCPGSCQGDLAADQAAEELTVFLPKHRLPKLS